MKRAVVPIAGLLLVTVVAAGVLGRYVSTSAPTVADVSQTSDLPLTSAVTVDPHFCNGHASPARASTTVPYTDAAHGLSIRLPYADQWQDQNGGKLSPYMQLRNGIGFGPLVFGSLDQGKTCTAVRAYTLSIGPVRNAPQIVAAVNASYGAGKQVAHQTTAGSQPAVEWRVQTPQCQAPVIELPGISFDVILSMSCDAPNAAKDSGMQALNAIAAAITVR